MGGWLEIDVYEVYMEPGEAHEESPRENLGTPRSEAALTMQEVETKIGTAKFDLFKETFKH